MYYNANNIVDARTCGIYGLRCTLTGKWYVGETKGKFSDRWNAYARLKCAGQPKLYAALTKYGYANFEPVVLEMCPVDKKILYEREIFWIDALDSYNNGYNATLGGFPNIGKIIKGRKFTDAHKRKLSAAKVGKHLSNTHKAKISVGNKGKTRPVGFREKMSAIRTGMVFSSSHKQHIAESKLGKKASEETRTKMRNSQRERRMWEARENLPKMAPKIEAG